MKHFPLSLILILSLFTSCHSDGNGTSSERTTDSVAVNYGHRHAQQLIDAQPDTPAMRRVLLDTRAYETRMRQEGLNQSADDYIQAFESHIRANDSTLAIALGL